MSTKLLVIFNSIDDAEVVKNIIKDTEVEILEKYPNSYLLRCPEEQWQALKDANLEVVEAEEPDAQVMEIFKKSANLTPEALGDSSRPAYYLIKLKGPVKGQWLETIQTQNGAVLDSLPGYILLIRILPDQISFLRDQDWIEDIGLYLPDTKLMPQPRLLPEQNPVNASGNEDDDGSDVSVEISLFQDEESSSIVNQIQAAGGQVLSETQQAIVAIIPTSLLDELVKGPGIRAIWPHAFPTLHNDRAAKIIGIPPDHTFSGISLKGTGQIVAVCDTGLDKGDPKDIHPDFQGRIVAIKNYPYKPKSHHKDAKYVDGPFPPDDGAADYNTHGTHVAGSVLGDGSAAKKAGASFIPQGIAPEAQLYFQAIGQVINWKSTKRLVEEDIARPDDWPWSRQTLWGLPDNLTELFKAAYEAGARIHTNSWGQNNNNLLGSYSPQSEAVDEFMWAHRDMLILFSAGNQGSDKKPRPGEIDFDTITPPGTAKNCLTVGASENHRPHSDKLKPGWDKNWTDLINARGEKIFSDFKKAHHVSDDPNEVALLSSRGQAMKKLPVKPDLVAPGTNILSTLSAKFDPTNSEEPNTGKGEPGWGSLSDKALSGFYCWYGGTSMSTALVAGAAALIRQYLTQERGHVEAGIKPSGALIKAFLINGANPSMKSDSDAPNAEYGFGRVDLGESLSPHALNHTHFVDDPDLAVSADDNLIFEVRVADLLRPLRITLAWTDAPGSLETKNLLSLTVRPVESRSSSDNQSSRPRNNVQRRIIDKPEADIYRIRVRGENVTKHSPVVSNERGRGPRQDFALVVSNATSLTRVKTFR